METGRSETVSEDGILNADFNTWYCYQIRKEGKYFEYGKNNPPQGVVIPEGLQFITGQIKDHRERNLRSCEAGHIEKEPFADWYENVKQFYCENRGQE